MKAVLLVALGGALGALSRWAVGSWVDGFTTGSKFPVGILAVNLIGCLVIGVVFGISENRQWMTETARLSILVGFLGSFTTFSTFGWNTFELIRGGQALLAFANVLISVAGGLAAVWLGWIMAK